MQNNLISKILLVCNDSINKPIYDEVHDWYVNAFQLTYPEASIEFGITTPKKHKSIKTDRVWNFNMKYAKDALEYLSDYDFVFISLFTVDKIRRCYEDCTADSLNAELQYTGHNVPFDENDTIKIKQNIRLIEIADYCKANNVPYVCYTFDPMIDMSLKNHQNYSFLNIDTSIDPTSVGNKWKLYPILSNIKLARIFASFLTETDRPHFASIAYNENLQFLLDKDYLKRSQFTKAFESLEFTKVNLCATSFDKVSRKLVQLGNLDLTNYKDYTLARRQSRFSFVIPNYDGMTLSWRRVYEDLSVGCIPIILYSNDTKHVLDQIPNKYLDFLFTYQLIINIDEPNFDQKLVELDDAYCSQNRMTRNMYDSYCSIIKSEQFSFKLMNRINVIKSKLVQ